MDAGHFIPAAGGQAVYFEYRNVHCQCKGCNAWPERIDDSGQSVKQRYRSFMVKEYGIDEIARLIHIKHASKAKLRVSELRLVCQAWKLMCDDFDDIVETETERLGVPLIG